MLTKILRNCKLTVCRRQYASLAQANTKENDKMSSWQIHSYGGLDELMFSKTARIPHISNPSEVLIKVHASSVNPLDVAMIGGYGSTALNFLRNIDNIEFPLTLGRDFCGTVVSKGCNNTEHISVGSTVWGVVPVHQQGCHADYVVVDASMVTKKPENMNTVEAASMLYTSLTAWSGLTYSANVNLHNTIGLKVLVMGASGGVGNSAVQMLSSGGAKVTASCASDARSLVESLGADVVLDYTSSTFNEDLAKCGRFDIILDCAGLGSDYITKSSLKFRRYVTFTTPVLKNFDDYGIIRGILTSIPNIICPNIKTLKNGSVVTWAYFVPCNKGLHYIKDLVENKKLKSVIESTFSFNDLPAAYEKVKNGHLRGKVVINISNVD